MTLATRLTEYIAAAFTGIWIKSAEHHDALREIAQLARQNKWALATWDVDRGLSVAGNNGQAAATNATDPVAAIRALNALAKTDSSALLVLPNFHRFLQSSESNAIVQALAHQIQAGKNNRTFIVILSPIVQIPIELEKCFVVIEHELPDREQLQTIASGIATEKGEMPKGEDLQRLLDAAAGLTRVEAESAFSLSLVRHRRLEPQSIWELKGSMLKKSGLVSLYCGGETFADLGGLEPLKDFSKRIIRASGSGRAVAHGLMLVSLPGAGKSLFCKALGNETGRPTLVLNTGALMGSLVGQTEERTRQVFSLAKAMAPCNVFLDEADKALAGASSSGDSGVTSRLFGSLLSFMSDHESDIFFIMTANDITRLPPEFTRAERFDAVFFIDLPGRAEKDKIWPIHLARYGHDPRAQRPDDRDWTGAEIQSCCRLAALLDMPLIDAAKNVVPVAVTAAESVDRLRAWAAGRCLDASRPGIYVRATAEPAAPSNRRVSRPSNN